MTKSRTVKIHTSLAFTLASSSCSRGETRTALTDTVSGAWTVMDTAQTHTAHIHHTTTCAPRLAGKRIAEPPRLAGEWTAADTRTTRIPEAPPAPPRQRKGRRRAGAPPAPLSPVSPPTNALPGPTRTSDASETKKGALSKHPLTDAARAHVHRSQMQLTDAD